MAISIVLDRTDMLEIFSIERKEVSIANRMKMREPFSRLMDAASAGLEFSEIWYRW